jgi:hypothetical protein
MRISDFFRSRFSTPRLSHPVFGPCRFFHGREPASSYWEAQVVVPGFEDPLDLAITAPESGPTEEHVQFFQKFTSSPEHFVSLAGPSSPRLLNHGATGLYPPTGAASSCS